MSRATQLAKVQVIALVLVLSTSSRAVGEATVSGVVTDSAGSEVAHASVEAMPRGGGEKVGTVGNRPSPWIQADSHGRFNVSLPPGRYKIHAKDDLDGYPDPVYLLNFDSTAKFPEIAVGQKDISNVRVVLGKRGGVLDGELVDLESRSPLSNGKVTIRDAQNAEAYVEVFANASGQFQFAVPTKPILISASAPGYMTVDFAGGAELTLSGGERRTILLELQHR